MTSRLNFTEALFLSNRLYSESMMIPQYASIINILLDLEGDLDLKKFKEAVREIEMSFPRFRMKVEKEKNELKVCSGWVELNYHVVRENDINECERSTHINQIVSEYLDENRPLWRFHVYRIKKTRINENIDNINTLIIARVHHAIADGFSLLRVLNILSKSSEEGAVSKCNFPILRRKYTSKSNIIKKIGSAMIIPFQVASSIISNIRSSIADYETENLGFLPPREHRENIVFTKRHIMEVDSIKLSVIKEIATRFQVTINDVMISLLLEALREYSKEHTLDSEIFSKKCLFRVMMPFGFIPRYKTEGELGNKWAMCSACFGDALACESSLNRLWKVHKLMKKIKKSLNASVSLFMINKLMKYFPLKMMHDMSKSMFQRHGMIMSNIPGPQEYRWISGCKLKKITPVFFSPVSLCVFITYAGEISLGATLDTLGVQNPQRLKELIHHSVHHMHSLVLAKGKLNK